jgi:hypothetical protein
VWRKAGKGNGRFHGRLCGDAVVVAGDGVSGVDVSVMFRCDLLFVVGFLE